MPASLTAADGSHRRNRSRYRSVSPAAASPQRHGDHNSSTEGQRRRRNSSHFSTDPEGIVRELLIVSKQFRETFLPSVGKRTLAIIKRFEKTLHFPDADRDAVTVCLHRCQSFMIEVETLLRNAVEAQIAVDGCVVNFAYLRWGEAQELSRGVKRVLMHKHSGVSLYCPDADVGPLSQSDHMRRRSGGAVVSVVQRSGGGAHVSPARAVLHFGGAAGRRTTPVAFQRIGAHALPNYESIAARWSSPRRYIRRQPYVGLHDLEEVGSGGEWRSAIDELRAAELAQLERTLLDQLLIVEQHGSHDDHCQHHHNHGEDNEVGSDAAAAAGACSVMLYRIRGLFADLYGNASVGTVRNEDEPLTFNEEGEAAFLMWLSTVHPKQLRTIEWILSSSC
jgi:hypothetical protein